ncbi:MAG: hypothetical protein IT345_10675 [Trueperaceae bacterium]|nr:hypothetical protein [Trueperaceae bacterium]
MREQRAAEDRAVFDAYNNGGLFKGQPVTDSRLLGYIRGRRDGFDTADPLYDEWNNRFIQQKFTIGEQEIGLRFKQGKVGAGAVAAFYRGQLDSIPKDSAFYREVAGRAAEWSRAASGVARGRARAAANAHLTDKFNENNQRLFAYLQMEAIVTEYARRAGIVLGNQKITDADATDLIALFDSGLTGLQGEIISFDDFSAAAQDYYKALGRDIKLTQQAGRTTKTKESDRAKFLSQNLIRLNTIDDRAKYELARGAYDEAVEKAGGDPYAVIAASNAYAENLAGIRDTALAVTGKEQNDSQFIGGLNNEIAAVLTGEVRGPTVTDLYASVGEGVTRNDVSDLAKSATDAQFDAQEIEAGRAFIGQAEPGGSLQAVPFPPGAANDPFGKGGLDDSYQPSYTTIDGNKRTIILKGERVNASVVRDVDGRILPPDQVAELAASGQLQRFIQTGQLIVDSKQETPIGYVFTNPTDNRVNYGVVRPDGSMVFTSENPFETGLFADGTFAGIEGLTVFTETVNPNTGAITGGVKPVSITGENGAIRADPVLTDSTVAANDLIRLAESGQLRLNEQDVSDYVSRQAQRVEYNPSQGPGGVSSVSQARQDITSFQEALKSEGLGAALIAAIESVTGGIRASIPTPDSVGPIGHPPVVPPLTENPTVESPLTRIRDTPTAPKESPLTRIRNTKPSVPKESPLTRIRNTPPKPDTTGGGAVGSAIGDIIAPYLKPKPKAGQAPKDRAF